MNVGVNYMREHMPSDARIHYALLDAGGIAPNVVQAKAKVRYLVRARDLPELNWLVGRVRKVADGAALMTETSVTTKVVSAVSNLLGNGPLEKAMQANLDRLGPPPFDDADRAFAAKIQATLSEEDIETSYRRVGMPKTDSTLCDVIVPLEAKGEPMMGSTDVGDVSWAVPTVQARGATYAIGTPGHSWQLTAQGKMPAAHKGMVHVAKVMAGTALDAIQDETLVARAKAEHQARLSRSPVHLPDPRGRAAPDRHVRRRRLTAALYTSPAARERSASAAAPDEGWCHVPPIRAANTLCIPPPKRRCRVLRWDAETEVGEGSGGCAGGAGMNVRIGRPHGVPGAMRAGLGAEASEVGGLGPPGRIHGGPGGRSADEQGKHRDAHCHPHGGLRSVRLRTWGKIPIWPMN